MAIRAACRLAHDVIDVATVSAGHLFENARKQPVRIVRTATLASGDLKLCGANRIRIDHHDSNSSLSLPARTCTKPPRMASVGIPASKISDLPSVHSYSDSIAFEFLSKIGNLRW